jgi:succinoglycan biosynthesis transport protein ExoP
MEIRDYLRMLRRGWPAVALITTLFVGIAAGYLVLAPKRYDATTVLFVSAASPKSISDLNQSAQFSGTAATTYAEIIDSGTVLAPVAQRLRPQMEVDDLGEMVESTVREETTLIDVTVSGTERKRVATIANAVGLSASQIIPELEATATGRDLVRIQQIGPAVEPTRVASPNPKRTLALGFVVGLFVGLAVTIVAQSLDNRIRHVEEVRQLADVSLLAALPPLKRAERRGVIVRDRPSSMAGEAFRTLRTNISVLGSRDRPSLLITGVTGDRDGAQVPVNLAWTLAQTGQQVLLVDLDLRRSTVGDMLAMQTAAGMSDVLAGQHGLQDVIRPTEHPCLSVVLSGTPQPSPSELLTAPSMSDVLTWMERNYDHVILHAPPLLSYTDAAVVAGVAGGTLITVAAGSTQGQQLTTALIALTNIRVKPLGLVLTHVNNSAGPARVRSGMTRTRPRPGRSVTDQVQLGLSGREPRSGSHARHAVDQNGGRSSGD